MNKKNKKLFLLLCVIFFLTCNNNAFSFTSYATEKETIESTRNVAYTWEYKKENNKMYKRKVDVNTGKALTDWIFVKNL